jgi:hypothetical protein
LYGNTNPRFGGIRDSVVEYVSRIYIIRALGSPSMRIVEGEPKARILR